jgi:Nucleotidyltransferase of unknown function (DUF6036)
MPMTPHPSTTVLGRAASTVPELVGDGMESTLGRVAGLLAQTGCPYVVIGGHAVNVWLEPRYTADVDVTVQANAHDLAQLRQMLTDAGYTASRELGAELPSGPDFARFVSRDRAVVLEIQTAKTEFQREAVRRGMAADGGLRIATPEDLIVFKLIANRPKDQNDLLGLVRLPNLDWPYVEHWATEWGVLEALAVLRATVR